MEKYTAAQAIVVKSTAPASSNPVEGLADFHYAKTFWYTSPGGSPHVACIDSGFGNSPVDDELQRQLYPDAECLPLLKPRMVEALGGAECTATHVVIMRIFMKGMDGRFTELVRPFHIFKDLSVPLLVGNDIMQPEKFDLLYSSNRLRIGACDGIPVRITVHTGHHFSRIPVRCAAPVTIPSGSSTIVYVKFGRTLKPNQDNQFTPIQTRSAISGAGAPHSVLPYNQKELLYTNFADRPLTIFKGTVLGHVQSLESSADLAWDDVSKDIKALFGNARDITLAMAAAEIFNPHQMDTVDPNENTGELFCTKTRPRPVPAQSKFPVPDNGRPCASEVFENPQWLQEEYVPKYDHILPPYIKIPDITTSTWRQVVINREDDISDAQVVALEDLIHQHRGIFNDIMGCVREPEEDWLRIDVPVELEVKLKPTGLYRLTARGRKALDEQFDLNREYGRMSALEQPSPWDLKVFVVYQGTKARPVVDMRKLNAAMIGDAYPLPRQEEVIQAMQGMRWLGSVDITSAFHQHLIHPAHRYHTTISTHQGREVFNVSIMGGKTSVQHQQRLMDTKFIQRLSWRGASCYVDDIVMYAPSFAKFIGIVDKVFSILGNLGITLKAKKCFLGFHSLEILGYLVDRLGITTAEAKADAIQNIPYPATLAQLEMSGLVWAAKRLRPYMERAFVTFVTDHHSNVALYKMQSINTMSANRSSLRLHMWAIYLDQYRDHMRVVYSKGADF